MIHESLGKFESLRFCFAQTSIDPLFPTNCSHPNVLGFVPHPLNSQHGLLSIVAVKKENQVLEVPVLTGFFSGNVLTRETHYHNNYYNNYNNSNNNNNTAGYSNEVNLSLSEI